MNIEIKVMLISMLMVCTLIFLSGCADFTTRNSERNVNSNIGGINNPNSSADDYDEGKDNQGDCDEGNDEIPFDPGDCDEDENKDCDEKQDNDINIPEHEMKEKAKQTYLDTILIPILIVMNPDAVSLVSIDDISFRPFMGIFNGSLVAVFYGGKYHGIFTDDLIMLEIGGTTFYWGNGYPILVWNEGVIYKLSEAYGQRLLSREDLERIRILYIEYFRNLDN